LLAKLAMPVPIVLNDDCLIETADTDSFKTKFNFIAYLLHQCSHRFGLQSCEELAAIDIFGTANSQLPLIGTDSSDSNKIITTS
jgi:hypothetical protein